MPLKIKKPLRLKIKKNRNFPAFAKYSIGVSNGKICSTFRKIKFSINSFYHQCLWWQKNPTIFKCKLETFDPALHIIILHPCLRLQIRPYLQKNGTRNKNLIFFLSSVPLMIRTMPQFPQYSEYLNPHYLYPLLAVETDNIFLSASNVVKPHITLKWNWQVKELP